MAFQPRRILVTRHVFVGEGVKEVLFAAWQVLCWLNIDVDTVIVRNANLDDFAESEVTLSVGSLVPSGVDSCEPGIPPVLWALMRAFIRLLVDMLAMLVPVRTLFNKEMRTGMNRTGISDYGG